MKYPFWHPRPRRHWLRSIELGLIGIPACFLFFIILKLGGAISLAMLINEQTFNVWMILWLGALLLMPPFFLAHYHQFIHDDPKENFPQWLPRPRCFRRGIVNWVVFILAVATALILCLDWNILLNGSSSQADRHIENRIVWLNTTWVISAAYLFMLKDGMVWLFKELIKLLYALVGKTPKWVKSEKTQNNYLEKD